MNPSPEKTRIDKWLWAVRFFKSRSIAAEACGKGKIMIGNQPVKASRNIKVGETISIRNGAFVMQFEVLRLTENRVPAKMTTDFCKDITPAEELEKIKMHSIEIRAYRSRGEGRPTKKDRRELEGFIDF
jgi:ribosome-associated heat shock protein Hsp15